MCGCGNSESPRNAGVAANPHIRISARRVLGGIEPDWQSGKKKKIMKVNFSRNKKIAGGGESGGL